MTTTIPTPGSPDGGALRSAGVRPEEQRDTRTTSATARLGTGVRLHYVEQGDPAGEPLVFLHGWPDSWYSYRRVLSLLPSDRYHAYALDMRGFGDSQAPHDGYSIDDFTADVVAFLDAVGLDRATVVGHSFGTFVARRLAETHPDRVARLVLIGSAVVAFNDVTSEVLDIVRDLTDPVPEQFIREFQTSTIHHPVPDAFFDGLIAESRKLPAHAWRASLEGLLAFDDRDLLAHIAAPTLLLWGEHDGLFAREDQHRLVAEIPDARLIVYPDTGHCANWERPDAVAADLQAFVASRVAGR
jgi:non-heme chloroperoxidase